jgi:predicted Zn-dependent protease
MSISALRKSLLVCCASAFVGCQSVQTTHPEVVGVDREQRFLISEEQMQAAAAQGYQQQLATARLRYELTRDSELTNRVRRTARDLQRETSNLRPVAPGWNWETTTLASDDINAYALPGGKIMVFAGIVVRLDLTDDEIAAIVGHGIAHALREHSRERVSRQYAQQIAFDPRSCSARIPTRRLESMCSRRSCQKCCCLTARRTTEVIRP